MRACAVTLDAETTPAELRALVDLLRSERLGGRHLEIGTAAGGTLKELMSAYPAETRPAFSVVDPMTYFPDQMDVVRRNLAGRGIDPDGVDFRVSTSAKAAAEAAAAGDRFSFLFIDGDHSAVGVVTDLAWLRLLEVGGIACFHDVSEPNPGVRWAVGRFLAANRNYAVVDHVESLLIVRKTAPTTGAEVSWLDRWLAGPVKLTHKWRRSLAKRLA